jgi:hypothetical protein
MIQNIIATPFKNSLTGDGEKTVPVVNKVKVISYSACEHLWSYLGKIALIIRSFLNATARNVSFVCKAGKDYADKLKNFTTHMKLLSIVGVIFSMVDLQASYQKFLKNVFFKDWEGIALSTISVTIIASDILDSVTTFVNTTLAIACAKTVSLFSALGLPLGFVMSGLGTVSRMVQIAKASILHGKIHHEIISKRYLDKTLLKNFLEKTLCFSEELKILLSIPPDQLMRLQKEKIQELQEANKAVILRAAPSEAVQDMEGLLVMLQNSAGAHLSVAIQEQVGNRLEIIEKHIRKKMAIDSLGITGNMFSLSALILFAGGASGSLPFSLLVFAFSARLFSVIYQDHAIIK